MRHDLSSSILYDCIRGCRSPPYNLKSVSRLITLIVTEEDVRFASCVWSEKEEEGTIFAFFFLNIFSIYSLECLNVILGEVFFFWGVYLVLFGKKHFDCFVLSR